MVMVFTDNLLGKLLARAPRQLISCISSMGNYARTFVLFSILSLHQFPRLEIQVILLAAPHQVMGVGQLLAAHKQIATTAVRALPMGLMIRLIRFIMRVAPVI